MALCLNLLRCDLAQVVLFAYFIVTLLLLLLTLLLAADTFLKQNLSHNIPTCCNSHFIFICTLRNSNISNVYKYSSVGFAGHCFKTLVSQLLVFVISVYRHHTFGCAMGFPSIICLNLHVLEKGTMFLYPLHHSAFASNFPSPVQVIRLIIL